MAVVIGSTGVDYIGADDRFRLIDATSDADTIQGLAGNDSINGRGGSDRIDGGGGNDTLIGFTGNYTLIGGAGRDEFQVASFRGALSWLEMGISWSPQSNISEMAFIADFSPKEGDKISLMNFPFLSYGSAWLVNFGIIPAQSNVFLGMALPSSGSAEPIAPFFWIPNTSGTYGWGVVDLNRSSQLDISDLVFRVALGDGTSAFNVGQDWFTRYDFAVVGSSDSDNLAISSHNATLVGAGGNDRLTGSAAADLVLGGTGADTIYGSGGDDRLLGLEGADRLSGGDGDDTIWAGNGEVDGNDTLLGGAGNDDLDGDAGQDIAIFSGRREDYAVFASGGLYWVIDLRPGSPEGNDQLTGVEFLQFQGGRFAASSFKDAPVATTGPDRLFSGIAAEAAGLDGNDTITGDVADDYLLGGSGLDELTGFDGNDNLDGGDGADKISGGKGQDTLVGGGGADTLDGGQGRNLLDGGDGLDFVKYEGFRHSRTLTVDGGGWGIRLAGPFPDMDEDRLIAVEWLTFLDGNFSVAAMTGALTASNDRYSAGSTHDTIDGLQGNDVLRSGAGFDLVFGAEGADNLLGEAGSDTLGGGASNDTLQGGAGDDYLLGGLGGDRLLGGDGADVLYDNARLWAYAGDRDTVDGGTGDDVIVHGGGADSILGGDGSDTLLVLRDMPASTVLRANLQSGRIADGHGDVDSINGIEHIASGAQNDTLIGDVNANRLSSSHGADSLRGEAGNDTLIGGAGADTLLGGVGRDHFRFASPTDSGDTIRDYRVVDDAIEISGYGFNLEIGIDLNASGRFSINSTGLAAATFISQFIYEIDDRILWWDADGVGSAQPTAVARFASAVTGFTGSELIVTW